MYGLQVEEYFGFSLHRLAAMPITLHDSFNLKATCERFDSEIPSLSDAPIKIKHKDMG